MQTMKSESALIPLEHIASQVRMLSPDEQLHLIEILFSEYKKNIQKKKAKHSIMELQGLGAEIWKGIDAQEYVRKERESWD
ncbi:MAG: hypothetical protein R2941_01835 [Desulfobacterales bacterium]